MNRLTFGDQDRSHVIELLRGTADWVKKSLVDRGISWPPELDIGRLYGAPSYAEEFIELIEKLLRDSHNARCLVVAMETSQFGNPSDISKFPLLQSAASSGDKLAAFVRGFVIRSLSVPKPLANPAGVDITAAYPWGPKNGEKTGIIGRQLKL
jgi:hypothetical protein